MYRTVARLTIIPGNEDVVLKAAQKLAEDVRQNEPATLSYLMHTPNVANKLNNPKPSSTELWTYEVYRDAEAFKQHITGPYFTGFIKSCGDKFVQAADRDVGMFPGSGVDLPIPYILATELELQAGFIRPEQQG